MEGYSGYTMKATLYLIRIILAPCLLVFGPLCLLTLINQLVRLGDLVKGSLNNTGLLIEMVFALMPTVFLHASTASAFFFLTHMLIYKMNHIP